MDGQTTESSVSTTPSATVTVTEPTSTAEVASQAFDAFEAAESNGTDDGETSAAAPVAEPAAEPKAAPVAKTLTEAEQLLHDAGYKAAKKPDGRDNYIPHSKVVKIIENGLAQGKGAFGQKYQALETEATTLKQHMAELRADLSGDPKAFLSKIAEADPRYKVFLEPQAAPAVPSDRPAPDVDLGNGQMTYSLEQNDKLIEWKARQMLEERFKPIEEREAQIKARAKQAEAQRAFQTRYQQTMTEAQTWPGFGSMAPDGSLSEFQQAVLGRLTADSEKAAAAGKRPSMTLREAYLEVHAERLSTDHNKVRETILKELNGAPRSTAVSRSGGETAKIPAGASTADIAARTLERLERGA